MPAISLACLVQGALGATTVGGTLAVCRLLGIRFLGTGGIGGVHRGHAQSLDVSGDLPQIARSPAVVVCSGVKSILDVAATAELLETLGVPVLGWQSATMPAFYSAGTGPATSAAVSSAPEAARIAAAHWQLNPGSGLILTRHPGTSLEIEPLIADAVEQVRRAGVTGQAVTPAVLALVAELSDGRSVEVNRQLIADNAGLAAEVAVAYANASAAVESTQRPAPAVSRRSPAALMTGPARRLAARAAVRQRSGPERVRDGRRR